MGSVVGERTNITKSQPGLGAGEYMSKLIPVDGALGMLTAVGLEGLNNKSFQEEVMHFGRRYPRYPIPFPETNERWEEVDGEKGIQKEERFE